MRDRGTTKFELRPLFESQMKDREIEASDLAVYY